MSDVSISEKRSCFGEKDLSQFLVSIAYGADPVIG